MSFRFPSLSRRTVVLATIAGFFLLAFLIYGQTLRHGFIALDDDLLVTDNDIVRSLSAQSLWRAFTTYDPELYIPLTLVSLQIDWLLGGGTPGIFHATNILLHTINALLVAWGATLLLRQRTVGIVVGLLFLLHPLQTEAVAWISARKDLLSSLFFLGAIVSWLRWRDGWSAGWRISLELFVLALLSKVTVVALPIILLLIDAYRGRSMNRQSLRDTAPFFLLSLLFGAIALGGKSAGLGQITLLQTLLVSARAIWFYLAKLLWPARLSLLYPIDGVVEPLDPQYGLALLGSVVLLVVALLLRRRLRSALLALAFAGLTLAPSLLNILKGSTLYLASDRYVYLPSIAVFLLVATGMASLQKRYPFRLPAVIATLFIATLGFTAHRQASLWRNDGLLFSHALAIAPTSAVAWNALGNVAWSEGRTQDALTDYRKAAGISPASTTIGMNLAAALHRNGQSDAAIAEFLSLLAREPRNAKIHYRLGNLLSSLGRKDEAMGAYQASLSLDPAVVMKEYRRIQERGDGPLYSSP